MRNEARTQGTTTNANVPQVASSAQRAQQVRREIAAGTYLTEEKLESAIDSLYHVLFDHAQNKAVG